MDEAAFTNGRSPRNRQQVEAAQGKPVSEEAA